MAPQNYDPYREKIREVIHRFCARKGIDLTVMAQDLSVERENFYKIAKGANSFPQSLAVRVEAYMRKMDDPLMALRFIQAFFDTDNIGPKGNGQIASEIMIELTAQVHLAINDGVSYRTLDDIRATMKKLGQSLKKMVEERE